MAEAVAAEQMLRSKDEIVAALREVGEEFAGKKSPSRLRCSRRRRVGSRWKEHEMHRQEMTGAAVGGDKA